eukprot:757894-Hanusia_phi.AAC.5
MKRKRILHVHAVATSFASSPPASSLTSRPLPYALFPAVAMAQPTNESPSDGTQGSLDDSKVYDDSTQPLMVIKNSRCSRPGARVTRRAWCLSPASELRKFEI